MLLLGIFILCASLGPSCSQSVMGQDTAGGVQNNAVAMKTGVLAIASDGVGTLWVDGSEGPKIAAGQIIKLTLVTGQHFVELRDDKNQKVWEKVVVVPAGAQAAERIELRAGTTGGDMTTPALARSNVTVPLGFRPSFLAINAVTNKIYVAQYGSNNITVLDGSTNKPSTVVRLSSQGSPTQPNRIAVNQVTNKIYVANVAANDVTIIDGTTDTAITVPVGVHPLSLAVNSNTNKIYVANSESDSVTVIDGKTNKTRVLKVAKAPEEIAINEATNTIYVSCGNSLNVALIDGEKDTVKTFITGPHWEQLALDPATNRLYSGGMSLAAGYAGDFTDLTSNITKRILAPTPLSFVTSLAVNQVTHKAYLYSFFGKKGDSVRSALVILDGLTNEVHEIKLKSLYPGAVAVNSGTNKIYVTNFDLDSLTEVDGNTNSLSTIPIGKGPSKITINPLSNKVYVIGDNSNLAVLDGTI